jgi:GNAT superfamily N-acetyltransferase
VIDVGPLRAGERETWEELARGYKRFYRTEEPDDAYGATWQRLLAGTEMYGLGARIDGELVGIVHYHFHVTFWAADSCYLQDLFVSERARGQGAATALIQSVAAAARNRGASCLYWLTQEDNARARALYDRVAHYEGFIRYDYPLT